MSGDFSKVTQLLRGELIQPSSLQPPSLRFLLPTALSLKRIHVTQSHKPVKMTALTSE